MTLPDELNFIKKGQLWAIVGESDSGHSALVNSIWGKSIENVLLKHQFTTLSNTHDFYYQQRFNSIDSEDALTVQQHLELIAQNNGYWNLGNVINILHLEKLMDEQIIKLSNGETKRLLIASALLKNPELITLDHPLTGLDKDTREAFSIILNEISKTGTMVIMATDPQNIPAAITHVAVMQNNRIIHTGRKESFDHHRFNFGTSLQINSNELHDLIAKEEDNQYSIIIQMNNVSIQYDGKKILDNINWIVKQGERWALTGPNGAGKSTLLSLVNGDNPQAYANDIILFDRKRGSGESIWDIKKQTGFISPELYQYFPGESSCLHVIESGFYDTIGLFRQTDPDKEAICIRWMKLMHIDRYAFNLFSRVPSGVQRLCLLARANIKNPTLLILDEPTQGLDLSQQQFFIHLIDEICSHTNVTVIYVSHYEEHIPKAVNKRIRLMNGKVI
jgi:molybdate transport system ATP-binding protein